MHRLLLLIVLLLPLAACTNAPLRNADVPITQQRLSEAQVGQAVKDALVARKWAISDVHGNSLTAEYAKPGAFRARIAVSWDTHAIAIRYLDSQGLGFAQHDGERSIHHNYNRWIGNLEHDLPVFLGRIAAQ